MKCHTTSRTKINTDSFSIEVIRVAHLFLRKERQMEYLMESGSACGNFFILLNSPTTKAVNDSYINMTL